jgi:GNAT superfamily N-acetyltransferase
MSDLPVLRGSGFVAWPLEPSDGPALQRLLESCADFWDLLLGLPPGPAEAQAVFLAGPEEGADPAGKMMFGIKLPGSDDMVGVLDVFRDYPEAGAWYVGLLLINPDVRSSGLGRAVMAALSSEAQRLGARELQLNVVEQNAIGDRFWKSLGFSEARRWRQHYGEKESTFIRMRREL